MSSIKGAELPLFKVFSSDFQYSIPTYQRPYAWQLEQATELFDDLRNFWQEEGEEEQYFLGSIVLIKGDKPAADVVDGQQRLTTLTLLLAAIRDRLRGEGDWDGAYDKYIMEPGDKSLNLTPRPRLQLREKDRDFFRRYVQEPGGTAALASLDMGQFQDSQLNLIRNVRAYLERLTNWPPERVGEFGRFIVSRCLLVVVISESFKSAYRIFSVMNDRGLELETSDILKADIIGSLGESDRAPYTARWEDMEERLGRTSFNELFMHVRMIVCKEKARRSILDEFTELVVKPRDDGRGVIDDLLVPYAEMLDTINRRAFQSTADPSGINELLEWLQYLNNSDWIPVAMAFMRRFGHDVPVLHAHLKNLERLGASLFIRGFYATPRIERFAQVLHEMDDGHDMLESGSALDLSPQEQADTLRILDGNVYSYSQRLRAYIVTRMDAFLSEQFSSYTGRLRTIEHVLPQNPASNSLWRQNWTEDQREEWVHRIGNLLLLSRAKNSEASNYDFETKKEKYFRTKSGVSTYASATQVLDYESWTTDDVERRQGQLLALFSRKWDLHAIDRSTAKDEVVASSSTVA